MLGPTDEEGIHVCVSSGCLDFSAGIGCGGGGSGKVGRVPRPLAPTKISTERKGSSRVRATITASDKACELV